MASDLTDLAEALKDIDPAKLPHGLEQYRRFGPKTVRAILAVRDLVVHTTELSETVFRVGLTQDPQAQESEDRALGCVAFQVLFESSDHEEARVVEADVRLNFLWHFPGRCLNKADYRQEDSSPGRAFVYVTCFPPGLFTIPGKA